MSFDMGLGSKVFVGLGTNKGDRLGNLKAAVEALAATPNTEVDTCSSVFENPAQTLTPDDAQPDYLNAVVGLTTSYTPHELLLVLLEIEKRLGRNRNAETRWGPRTLDLDLLVYGSVSLHQAQLTLPHPRLAERQFVLVPFAEIAPNLVVPHPFNATVAQLLQACSDTSRLVRLEGVTLWDEKSAD